MTKMYQVVSCHSHIHYTLSFGHYVSYVIEISCFRLLVKLSIHVLGHFLSMVLSLVIVFVTSSGPELVSVRLDSRLIQYPSK